MGVKMELQVQSPAWEAQTPGESGGVEEGETYYEKGVGGERSEVWVWPSDHGESEMPVCEGLCCSVGEGELWEVKK